MVVSKGRNVCGIYESITGNLQIERFYLTGGLFQTVFCIKNVHFSLDQENILYNI